MFVSFITPKRRQGMIQLSLFPLLWIRDLFNSIILSSLFYFVEIQSSRLSSKCLFNLWHQRETKELSNFHCFSKSWNCSNSKVSFTFLKFNFIVSAWFFEPYRTLGRLVNRPTRYLCRSSLFDNQDDRSRLDSHNASDSTW